MLRVIRAAKAHFRKRPDIARLSLGLQFIAGTLNLLVSARKAVVTRMRAEVLGAGRS